MVFSSSVDSAVFDFGLVMAAIDEGGLYEPVKHSVIYIGVDPAGQGKDFAVAIALDVEENEKGKTIYTVCQMYRKRSGVSEQHLNAVAQMVKKLDAIATAIETNSMGQLWVENISGMKYTKNVLGVATTKASKPVLIGRLQMALESEVF